MGEERRRFPRVPQSFAAQCRSLGGLSESWRAVRTVDLSAVGMRVRSDEPFEFWTTLEIRIQVPSLREPLDLRGRVVWSRTPPSGMTEMGIEFVDLGPEQQEQIDELVQFLTDRE
ncbi:MAG: PilZ domain-containing protein [Candidatus Omnitrophica bacterium]|nr:PilZ domain-containing protein [Candidatus Omnitrophota bacterium]